MSWQGYPKDVVAKLKDSPAIRDGIENMARRGYSKETICRVIGAPYEVVDAQLRARNAGQTEEHHTESELREMSDRMTKARKAPRVVKPQQWGPIGAKVRTPEQIEAAKERMAKAREARGKKSV